MIYLQTGMPMKTVDGGWIFGYLDSSEAIKDST